MPKATPARLAVIGLLSLSLLLAACTRSASTAVVPTDTPGGDGGFIPADGQDMTMAAIGTEVSAQLTQTAVAAAGAGGGEELTPPAPGVTPVAPTTDPNVVAQPTATLDPGIIAQPTATVPGAVATTAPPAVAGGTCSNPYTVQQGDWIYKIARTCGVTAAAIIAANPGINPHSIVPGQVLNLPGAGASPVATAVPPAGGTTPCTGTYTVRTGDNLFRLAYNCGLTTEQLAAANAIPFPYSIYAGQVIRYP